MTLGSTSDTQAIVLSGVKPGETVVAERNIGIVEGHSRATDGAADGEPSPHP